MNSIFSRSALVIFLCTAQYARADFVIDSFNESGSELIYVFGAIQPSDTDTKDPIPTSEVAGGVRRLDLTALHGSALATLSHGDALGTLDWVNQNYTSTKALITYGIGAGGASIGDVTGGNVESQLSLGVVSNDHGFSYVLEIEDENSVVSTYSDTVAGGVVGDINMNFSDFVGTADLTKVDTIRLQMIAVDSLDLTLTSILATAASVVPEPSTLATAVFGIALVSVRRRRSFSERFRHAPEDSMVT
ncbi:MAG: PEP-CTERM sorting domain-containing protein [Planctomycetaceae bacterium]|nr:PEP-CTERM sorting domain-containing protein [Planctomycetaceae bacterium]